MNNKARFGNAFHDRIPCFNFNYPSEEERKAFLLQKIEKSKISFTKEQIESLVRETENKSYRQIERLWNNILFKVMEDPNTQIKNNKIVSSNEILENSIRGVLNFVSNSRVAHSMFG